jgi:hypothetical protein
MSASQRDVYIAELISTMQFEIVEEYEIPNEAEHDTEMLYQPENRSIEEREDFHNFVIWGKGNTSPTTFAASTSIVSRLRGVQIDYRNGTDDLSEASVLTIEPEEYSEIEMKQQLYKLAYQISLSPYNGEHAEYNVLLHGSRFAGGGWETVDYLAAINVNTDVVRLRNFRNVV